ncbi:MAG: hypothetical protein R3C45_13265 [Phycisphaerales bacterium]
MRPINSTTICAVVAGGGGSDTVEPLRPRRVAGGGGETERHVRAVQVVVDGLGHADTVDPVADEIGGPAHRAVPADHDCAASSRWCSMVQATVGHVALSTCLSRLRVAYCDGSHLLQEPRIAAACEDTADIIGAEPTDPVLHQPYRKPSSMP